MMERVWIKVAWWLPRRLVYWAGIRLVAHATRGKWSQDIVPHVTALDALRRWDEKAFDLPSTDLIIHG